MTLSVQRIGEPDPFFLELAEASFDAEIADLPGNPIERAHYLFGRLGMAVLLYPEDFTPVVVAFRKVRCLERALACDGLSFKDLGTDSREVLGYVRRMCTPD